jgi:ATP-dependent DNA helicase RecQ
MLKGEQQISIVQPPPKSEGAGRQERNRVANPIGDPLFEALRELRRELAAEAQLPPYVIFHDATLREMAALRPASRADLAQINGVGTRKLEAYGDAFLALIRRHG